MRCTDPGLDLHKRVRAGFVLQGKTLTEWCRANGTTVTNARAALLGTWNGPKGRAMRSRIVKAACIDRVQA